ncbi:DegQ Trypsin-like serine proteases, typically periplasmic, contain C-terminal PDZ domain [Burkholderiaceae bacterium]
MYFKFLILAGLQALLTPLVLAQQTPTTVLPRQMVERVMQSVVAIQARTDDDASTARTLGQRRQGSGVVIGPDLVLTIGYLLIEAQSVDLIDRQGRRVPAQVKAVDTVSGFGLVRSLVPLRLEPVPLGDSDVVKAPAKVLTLGKGEVELTELQVVSRKPFAGNWEYLLETPLMTLPAVNNWSGAGLFDEAGQLIGLGSLLVPDVFGDSKPMPGNLYVPLNELKPQLVELLRNGKRTGPAQSWLGISSQAVRGGGLMVQRVTPESPASQAGIQAGDVLVALQGRAIDNLPDFYRQLWTSGPAGSTLEITVKRLGQERKIRITTGDRALSLKAPRGV